MKLSLWCGRDVNEFVNRYFNFSLFGKKLNRYLFSVLLTSRLRFSSMKLKVFEPVPLVTKERKEYKKALVNLSNKLRYQVLKSIFVMFFYLIMPW